MAGERVDLFTRLSPEKPELVTQSHSQTLHVVSLRCSNWKDDDDSDSNDGNGVDHHDGSDDANDDDDDRGVGDG